MASERTLTLYHLYPEILNLYGDTGNVLVLKRRLAWRHIGCEVREVHVGETPRLGGADLVLIGGGSDREQRIVCESLLKVRGELASYVADDGVLLAVCGGYQLLGHSYSMGDEVLQGLSLVDLTTERGAGRLIGNVAVRSRIQAPPIVGFENHGGRTRLGAGVEPLGQVLAGHGNDGESGAEGCLYRNVVGTYVHGPLLPKNPGVADHLIACALRRRYGDATLEPLDDTEELAANDALCERLLGREAPHARG